MSAGDFSQACGIRWAYGKGCDLSGELFEAGRYAGVVHSYTV